jgi:hypothetical protein
MIVLRWRAKEQGTALHSIELDELNAFIAVAELSQSHKSRGPSRHFGSEREPSGLRA